MSSLSTASVPIRVPAAMTAAEFRAYPFLPSQRWELIDGHPQHLIPSATEGEEELPARR